MKRLIRASSHSEDYYANNVSMDVDSSVQFVIDSDIDEIDYKTLKDAVDCFFEDLKKIPSGMDELDIKYDRDKGRIYKKYRPLMDKCKAIKKSLHPTGYGKTDYIDVKKLDLCKAIDYRFPFGWKQFGVHVTGNEEIATYRSIEASSHLNLEDRLKRIIIQEKGWKNFLDTVEYETGLKIDSAYKRRRRGEDWLILLDESAKDGVETYEAEITEYFDGTYELDGDNIHRAF